MRGVDLARYAFDFDLTFSVLLAHPNGHVYHRYGGRDHLAPDRWLGLEAFEDLLRETLGEHKRVAPVARTLAEPLLIEKIPSFVKRDKGECVHCHSVFPAFYKEARGAGTWKEDDRWVYPPPSRIGLELDPQDPMLVLAVEQGSFAGQAGLRTGDRLLASATQRLLSYADLGQVLHDFSGDGGELPLEFARAGSEKQGTLKLTPGWKRGTPLEFSWRAFKWGFNPAPGFGGPELTGPDKQDLGLEPEVFAFRVGYLVTWGENRRFGQQAAGAGLRVGDVFLSAAGKSDFDSHQHFHAWWRLTRKPGQRVEVVVLRAGKRIDLDFEVLR